MKVTISFIFTSIKIENLKKTRGVVWFKKNRKYYVPLRKLFETWKKTKGRLTPIQGHIEVLFNKSIQYLI